MYPGVLLARLTAFGVADWLQDPERYGGTQHKDPDPATNAKAVLRSVITRLEYAWGQDGPEWTRERVPGYHVLTAVPPKPDAPVIGTVNDVQIFWAVGLARVAGFVRTDIPTTR